MKREKKEKYILSGNIHTATLKFNSNIEKINIDSINTTTAYIKVSHEGKPHTATINFNRNGEVVKFSDFMAEFDTLLEMFEAEDYYFSRVDVKLDSFDVKHYQTFQKLNRYLIALLTANSKSKTNDYLTAGLINLKQKSACVKLRDYEIENYDRATKSFLTGNITEQAQSRLELRVKSRTNDRWQIADIKGLFDKLINKMYDAIEHRDVLIDLLNSEIFDRYEQEKEQCRQLFKFLYKYEAYIYSTKQMIDLLSLVGVKNAKDLAYRYQKEHKPEYISKSDLLFAVKEIKRAIDQFFNS